MVPSRAAARCSCPYVAARKKYVSSKNKLRRLLLPLALLAGSFAGVQMLPEDILELMHATNRQQIVQMVSDEEREDN